MGKNKDKEIAELKEELRIAQDALQDLLDGQDAYTIQEHTGLPVWRCVELERLKRSTVL